MTLSDIHKLTSFIMRTDSVRVWTYLQRFLLGATVLVLLVAVILYSGGSMSGPVFFTSYLYLLIIITTLGTVSIFSFFLSHELNIGMLDLLLITGMNPLKFLTGRFLAKFFLLFNLLLLQVPFCFFCITLGGISIRHLISAFIFLFSWLLFTSGICLFNTVLLKNQSLALKLSALVLIVIMGFSPLGPFERVRELQRMNLTDIHIFADSWIYLLVFLVLFFWSSNRFGRPAAGENRLLSKISYSMISYLICTGIVWKIQFHSGSIDFFDIFQYLILPFLVTYSIFKNSPSDKLLSTPKERMKPSATGAEAILEKDKIHIPDSNKSLFPFIHVLQYIISFIILLLTLITENYVYSFIGSLLLGGGLAFQYISYWSRLITLIDSEMKNNTIESLVLLPLSSSEIIKCKMKASAYLRVSTIVSYFILCIFVSLTPKIGVIVKISVITLPLLKLLLDYLIIYIAFKVREATKTAAFTMIAFLVFLHFVFPVYLFPLYIICAYFVLKLFSNEMFIKTLYQ